MVKVYSIDGITPVVHGCVAGRGAKTMRLVDALAEMKPHRRRIDIPGAVPLSELKRKRKA